MGLEAALSGSTTPETVVAELPVLYTEQPDLETSGDPMTNGDDAF